MVSQSRRATLRHVCTFLNNTMKGLHTLISHGIWTAFPQTSLCYRRGNCPHLCRDHDCNDFHGSNTFYGVQYPDEGPWGPPSFYLPRPRQFKTEHNVVDRLWISIYVLAVYLKPSWFLNISEIHV